MFRNSFDFSARSRTRVVVLTVLGTLFCIAAAFTIDGYSFEEGWRWGEEPINNLIIPLVVAPPFFYFLLSKLRELAVAHRELLVISSTDSLTECFNRRAFTALVDGYLDRMMEKREECQGALLVIDVDHFKDVNDRFGHQTGDQALKLIADSIRGTIRESDAVGRIGGEEFSVFLPETTPTQVETMAERIRLAVNRTPFAPLGERYPLSVSIGGANCEKALSFTDLYRRADRRLYVAKRNGRNRVEMHDSLGEGATVSAAMH